MPGVQHTGGGACTSPEHRNWQPVPGACGPARPAGEIPGRAGHAMVALLPWMKALQGQDEEKEQRFQQRCSGYTRDLATVSQGRASGLGSGST